MKGALVVTLLLAAYVGSYFAVLALPGHVRLVPARFVVGGSAMATETVFVSINGERMADYHGLPVAIFAPIHVLDKRWLRHRYWFTPRDQQLSFDWLRVQGAQ